MYGKYTLNPAPPPHQLLKEEGGGGSFPFSFYANVTYYSLVHTQYLNKKNLVKIFTPDVT